MKGPLISKAGRGVQQKPESIHVVKKWSCLHKFIGRNCWYVTCSDEKAAAVVQSVDDHGVLFVNAHHRHNEYTFVTWEELKKVVVEV